MSTVNQNHIEKAIEIVDNLNDEQLEQIFEKYAQEQEVLLSYIQSASTEYNNEELEGLLIYYFCLIMECFEQAKISRKQIQEQDIEAFEESYSEMLNEYFESDNFETIEEFTGQSDLSQFMFMEIQTADEDGTEFDEDTATQIFIVGIAMIALLSQNSNS